MNSMSVGELLIAGTQVQNKGKTCRRLKASRPVDAKR